MSETDRVEAFRVWLWSHEVAIPDRYSLEERKAYVEGAAEKAHEALKKLAELFPSPPNPQDQGSERT